MTQKAWPQLDHADLAQDTLRRYKDLEPIKRAAGHAGWSAVSFFTVAMAGLLRMAVVGVTPIAAATTIVAVALFLYFYFRWEKGSEEHTCFLYEMRDRRRRLLELEKHDRHRA